MTKKKTRELIHRTFYDNNGNPEKQLKEFKKLLKIAQESGDFYFAGLVFHMLAVVYNMLGDREKLFLNGSDNIAATILRSYSSDISINGNDLRITI